MKLLTREVKTMSKYFLSAVCAICLFATGCKDLPGKLVMPEWDVDLNLPVTNKVYTIKDVVKKQNYISIGKDSLYVINSDKYELSKSIVDFIKLDQSITSVNNLVSPTSGTAEVFLNFRTDNVDLESAIFQQGQIKITARNNSDLKTTIKFITPGITKQDGTPFSFSYDLNAREELVRTEQLANYKYSVPASQPEIFKDQFWIIASTQSSGKSSLGDNIGFDLQISDFLFSSVTGKFPTFSLGKKTSDFNINIGKDINNFRDNISLKGATLNLTSRYNSVSGNVFDLLLDSMMIIGKRNGQTFYLKDSTGSPLINLVLKNGGSSFVFNEHNSNIKDLLSFIPDDIEITASYKIDGRNSFGTVANTDSVKFGADFVTSSQFSLSKSTITDTVNINLSDDERSNIVDGQAANFTVQVENAMPLATGFKVTLLDKKYVPLFDLTNTNGSTLKVDGASVDVNSGNVTSPTLGSESVTLSGEQINQLSHAYYAVITTSVMTTGSDSVNPVKVAVHASDWIKLKVFGGVKYRIKN